MIVISGALVLVALVLLIFGITTTDLDFVYASIVVSLVSFVFLLIGILQRRGDRGSDVPTGTASPVVASGPAPVVAASAAPAAEGVTAVAPRGGSRRMSAEPTTEVLPVADAIDEQAAGGTVLVVPGRPRYHVAGCRYLTGKSATEVDAADAREEGFSPCGVCKPDDALAAQAPSDVPADEDVPGAEEPAVEPEPVAAAPARRARTPRTAAPAKRTARTAAAAPSTAAVAAAADPAGDPVLEAVAADAAPAAAPGGAAARRRSGTTVVVIPDRGKYHRAECRYVRNAPGITTMSKTAAARKGYDACGVCKPS